MSDEKTAVGRPSADRWRWAVLPAAFFNMLIHLSVHYNCGVINDAVIDTFHVGTVEASWLMSYYCALFAIASPLASALILLTDCRTCVIMSGFLGLAGFACSSLVGSLPMLYLTLGLAGIAQSLTQSASILALSYYFPNNLPLIHGVCLAGSGMGSFVHPVWTQTLIDTYGFHGTHLILGGLAFHSVFLGMVFRTNSLERKSKDFLTRREAASTWKIVCSMIIPPAEIFRIPAFLALVASVWFYAIAIQSMLVMLPGYIKRYVGLSIQEGSVAAMMFGGGSVASRLFSGIAASHENIGETILFVAMGAISSILAFCGKFIMDMYQGAYIYSFFFGLYAGGLLSLANSMLMKIVGIELSAHGYGLMMFTYGIAGLTGPPIIALLVEKEGPNMLFVMCGIITMLVSMLGLLTTILRKGPRAETSIRDSKVKDVSIDVTQDGGDRDDHTTVQAKSALLAESKIISQEDNPYDDDDAVEMRVCGNSRDDRIQNGNALSETDDAIKPKLVEAEADVHKRLLT